MAKDSEFQNLIDTLLNNPDSSERMKAARTLGDYVEKLDDEEYQAAKKALDRITSYNVCYTKLLRIHSFILSMSDDGRWKMEDGR